MGDLDDVVYGTPSPTFNRKMKTGVRNLLHVQSTLVHRLNSTSPSIGSSQLNSSSPSIGSRDLSSYSIGSSTSGRSPTFPTSCSKTPEELQSFIQRRAPYQSSHLKPSLQAFEAKSTPEMSMSIKASEVSNVLSMNSPSKSTGLVQNKTPEKSPYDTTRDKGLTASSNLPLPSETNFAVLRAKAILQKKMKDKLSPIKFPNHARSDFIKSSALLNSVHDRPKGPKIVQSMEKTNGVLKRKSDFISSNHSNKYGIPGHVSGIKKARAFAWPSSSESSSDEDEMNNFAFISKRLKSNQDTKITSIRHANVAGVSKYDKVSTGKCRHTTLHTNGKTQHSCQYCQSGSSSGIPKKTSPEHHKDKGLHERHKMKMTKTSHACKSSADNSTSTVSNTHSTLGISGIGQTTSNDKPVTSVDSGLSISPVFSSVFDCDISHISNDSTEFSLPTIPAINDISISPVFAPVFNPQTSMRTSRIGGMSPQITRIKDTRPESPTVELKTPPRSHFFTPTGNVLGGRANPFVVDLTTPESERMVQQIEQMENDEEMARKLQEELDKEFAMTLAQQQENVSLDGASGVPAHLYPADLSRPQNPADQYRPHWITPERSQRGRRTRATTAASYDNHYAEISNMLQSLHSELGSEMVNLGRLQGNVPARGQRTRTRNGRYVVVTPDRGGNDYEDLLRLGEMMGDAKPKGLSMTEMNRLPTVSYKSMKTCNAETAECHICMCDYEDGDTQKILPCFHSYHSRCIDKWITKNASCPVCRVEIKL